MDNGLSAFISTAVEHVNCALNALRFLPSRGAKRVLFGPLCTMGSRRDTFGPSSRSSRRCLTSFVLRISYLVLVFCYLACSLAKIKASSCHSNPPTHTHNTIWKLPEMACLYAHTHRHTQTDTPGRKHLHLRTHGSLEGGVAHAFLFFCFSFLALPSK